MKTTELKDVVDAFKKLQIKHYAIIENGIAAIRDKTDEVPDLDLMNEERELAFSNLKKSFEDLSEIEGELLDLEEIKKDLSEVMEKEALIRNGIEDYRAELRESVDRMNRGKMALKGYGGSGL